MKYSPLGQIILIRVDQPKTQDSSGLYISEEWKTIPPTGVVEAVGPDVTICKKGDRVFFERYAAIDTPFDEDLKACRSDNILVIYNEDS